MLFDEIETTKDVIVPTNLMERVIGQDNAVEKVTVAIKQRRNLLLVGPPGVGKSMLAKALAQHLPKPKYEISVVDNPKNQNKPIVDIRTKTEIEGSDDKKEVFGRIVNPLELPSAVAVRLGFRCSSCSFLSPAEYISCPNCGSIKYSRPKTEGDIVSNMFEEVLDEKTMSAESEVHATVILPNGKPEKLIYQRIGESQVRVLDSNDLKSIKEQGGRNKRNVIVPITRENFVHMSGASEVELLGDVRHDPYGMHPEIGTPAYLRVVAGAIHEAHEGVLFIDELPHLENLQNYILTAMQEKKFPITGRNPQSAGASVKVSDVPCDFLFVGACNISDVSKILPPLRSRIIGNGYEILLETSMKNTPENRDKILQFIAQEIAFDGRIPHARRDVLEEIIKEAQRRAHVLDNVNDALTLRLRDLGGIIRMGGDLAVFEGSEYIEKKHILRSIKESKSIEHQLHDRYGSLWQGLGKDSTLAIDKTSADKSYG
ncbi:MAG: ATP-binding protein [Candidatus Altiarchaeota archaeon]|nr:ATP-binding protein [Candidatus Altiarchaeota archaeon]